MNIIRIAGGLGAEVQGIDLAQPLKDSVARTLTDAWHEHLVLRFRGQSLSPEQFIAFSANFGELERHETYLPDVRDADHPELLRIKAFSVRGERIVFGQQWHADLTYTLRPAKGSCLYCLVLPPVGGDTLFANMQLAYDTLSPTLRGLLDGLYAVHDLTHGRSHRDKTPEYRAATRLRNPPVAQPMVQTHPVTGRKSLFVSEWMCPRIVGMSEDESAGLLAFLFKHSAQPEFQMRQSWQVGDVVLWDNRATLHMALNDYPAGTRREMLRTSIIGESSGMPWSANDAAGEDKDMRREASIPR